MINFENVSKVFQKNGELFSAVESFSLSIARGEFCAIVGPSGCGKSTLLNLVSGLARPTKGTVTYQGQPITSVLTDVGYITQKDNLLPWRTVEGNIWLPLEIRGDRARDRNQTVRRLVELVGLKGFEKHFPRELSGGMRKRVALARTLAYDPKVLLMDEPFGALDAQLKMVMQRELLKIWEATRKTVIFITHDLSEAITLADRAVVMTSRPGRVKGVTIINLPRPRDVFQVRFQANFGTLFQSTWSLLEEDVLKGEQI